MPSAPPQWRPKQAGPSSDEFREQLTKWKIGVPIAVVAYGVGPDRLYHSQGQHTSHFVFVHRALGAMFRGTNLVLQYVDAVRTKACAEKDGRGSIITKIYDVREYLPTNPRYGGGPKANNRAPKGATGIHPECWPSVFEQDGFPTLLLHILSAPCQLLMQGPRAQVHALRSLSLPLSGSAARAACTAQHRQAFSSPVCSAPWE